MKLDLINLDELESKRLNELENELNLVANKTINLDHDSLVLQKDNLYFNFKKERALTPLKIDIKKGALGWRLARAQHETHLKKAIGKTDRPLRILDATAGYFCRFFRQHRRDRSNGESTRSTSIQSARGTQ